DRKNRRRRRGRHGGTEGGVVTELPAASAAPAALREVPLADAAVPRMELAEWADRYGVVAGVTTRGHGLSLGLWSAENVGQVMSRWRAVGAGVPPRLARVMTRSAARGAAFHPRYPGLVLAHQVHGTALGWHRAAADGWMILDGLDGHATGARGLLLTVTVADCIPVYLVVPQKQIVALLHAGWRGVAGRVLERGVDLLKREGFARASDIVM